MVNWSERIAGIRLSGRVLRLLNLQLIILRHMPRIPKSETCDKGRCKKHAYILKPISRGLYFPKAQRAKFCPRYNRESRKFESSVPVLNLDHKEYTPLFILDQEKIYYEKHQEKMKASHLRKIEDCTQKSSIVRFFKPFTCCFDLKYLYVPRHARKRLYCSVCKGLYEEYLDHIHSEDHKAHLRRNKYNFYIKDLEKSICPQPTINPITSQEEFSSEYQKILSEQLKTG